MKTAEFVRSEIIVNCPHCDEHTDVNINEIGNTAECVHCDRTFRVPTEEY